MAKIKKARPKQSFDLPADIVEPMPYVYITGCGGVIIDGKCRLVDYSYEKIIFDIHFRGKLLVIDGEKMSMRCCIKNITEISGVIHSVSFESKVKD